MTANHAMPEYNLGDMIMIKTIVTLGLTLLMLGKNGYSQTPPHKKHIVFQTSAMQNVKNATKKYKENLSLDLLLNTRQLSLS